VEFPLLGLFASAFVSSTLLPGGSEALLAYLTTLDYPPAGLLLVATAGNTLGGMSGWLIGYWLGNRWPVGSLKRGHSRALERLRRWGSPVLLFSWVPVVGDPLCLAAGWLKVGWVPALAFIAVGKGIRYAAVVSLMTAGQ